MVVSDRLHAPAALLLGKRPRYALHKCFGVSVAGADLLGKLLVLKCELNSSSAKYINLVTPANANNLQTVNPFFGGEVRKIYRDSSNSSL